MRKRMYPVTLLAAFSPRKTRTLLERECRQKFAGKARGKRSSACNDKSYQTLRDVLGIATTIQFA